MKGLVCIVLMCMLAGCAVTDARIAHTAQQKLIGWSEVDLETCLGAPDPPQGYIKAEIGLAQVMPPAAGRLDTNGSALPATPKGLQ